MKHFPVNDSVGMFHKKLYVFVAGKFGRGNDCRLCQPAMSARGEHRPHALLLEIFTRTTSSDLSAAAAR